MVLMVKTLTLLTFLAVFSQGAFANFPGDSIDLRRIRHRAVRDLIIKEGVTTAKDFQALETSCYGTSDTSQFNTHIRNYRLNAGVEDAWAQYASVSPKEAWTGRMVHFDFLFSRFANRIIYEDEARDPMAEGNIIYVKLRLLNGIKNLSVAFEITGMDPVNKVIRFCYLKDGKSKGSQEIRFAALSDSTTLITHETHYHSDSKFRDRKLYPRFHERLVGEFHNNLRTRIETRKS